MAIERQLGTENNPDIMVTSSAVEVFPEPSRSDEIRNAAQLLVSEENILLDDEQFEDQPPEMSFSANLAEVVEENILGKLASDILSSINQDKESRSDWEKTYTDGLKYLGRGRYPIPSTSV